MASLPPPELPTAAAAAIAAAIPPPDPNILPPPPPPPPPGNQPAPAPPHQQPATTPEDAVHSINYFRWLLNTLIDSCSKHKITHIEAGLLAPILRHVRIILSHPNVGVELTATLVSDYAIFDPSTGGWTPPILSEGLPLLMATGIMTAAAQDEKQWLKKGAQPATPPTQQTIITDDEAPAATAANTGTPAHDIALLYSALDTELTLPAARALPLEPTWSGLAGEWRREGVARNCAQSNLAPRGQKSVRPEY